MTKIINLDDFRQKLEQKFDKNENRNIYLTVVKSIYTHMEKKPELLFETINLEASTKELFGEDRNRFAYAFVEMVQKLEIGILRDDQIPLDKEFEAFPKVMDLCVFFEKNTNKK